MCVCSLLYPPCKAHAPYCIVICGLPSCITFFHTVSWRGRFWKKIIYCTHKMCLLVYSATLSETFLVLRRNERGMTKNMLVFMLSTGYSCQILMKLENFSKYFLKNPQIWNITTIRIMGAKLFHADGRTDRRDEANSRFSQFCESA